MNLIICDMKIFPTKSEYHLKEHHIFDRLGKQILFNVGTMFFYEVTPLVCDIITLLEKDGGTDPLKALKDKYSGAGKRKKELMNPKIIMLSFYVLYNKENV